MGKDGLQLPCPLEELGCDTTSFDPYAYTWDATDDCVLAIHPKEDVNRIKQGKNIYYNVSGRNNTSLYHHKISATNQYKYTQPTTIRCTWLSTLVDSICLRGREWDSQEEHKYYNTTSLQCPLAAGYSYTNLSNPIQMTLTQEHLTTSTYIMILIKVQKWIIHSSKAQRCLKVPRYNFKGTYANKREPKF